MHVPIQTHPGKSPLSHASSRGTSLLTHPAAAALIRAEVSAMGCGSGIDVCAKKVRYPVIKKRRAEAENHPGPTMPETKQACP